MKNQMTRRVFLRSSAITSLAIAAQLKLMGMGSKRIHEESFNKAVYQFNLGNFKCICVNDGGFNYPPVHFFKNVEEELVRSALSKKNLPLDHIYTPYTHLIVDTGEFKVLVDMGAGKKLPGNGNLPIKMKMAGLKPADIDIVIITHAHPDHIGGTLNDEGNPIYTNAKYYIFKDEWDFWFSDLALEKTNEFFVNTAREQLSPIKNRTTFIDRDGEILPGIGVIFAPGHTPGHIVVSFNSEGKKLYYVGDTVLFPLHLEHPDWLPIYDIIPEQAEESKVKIFNLVSEEEALVIGQHFPPFPSIGHVKNQEIGWKWIPIIESSSKAI